MYPSQGTWHRIHAADVNNTLRCWGDGPYSAKEFRTWAATVLAAVALARELVVFELPTDVDEDAIRLDVERRVRELLVGARTASPATRISSDSAAARVMQRATPQNAS